MSKIESLVISISVAMLAQANAANNQAQTCTLNPGQTHVTTFLDAKLKREGNAISEEDGYVFKAERRIKVAKSDVLVGKLVRRDGSIAENKSYAYASEWACRSASAEDDANTAMPDVVNKVMNKKWSLGDLPCNLNGGTYTIYTNQPPSGVVEYLGGNKNQSEQKQDFEYRTSNTEANVLFRRHTIYADGNKFVMQQVGDPNTVVSEVIEKITLQSNTKLMITREIKQIDFDKMLAGKISYNVKAENSSKNLCK